MSSHMKKTVALRSRQQGDIHAELTYWEEDPDMSENVLIRLSFLGKSVEASSDIGFFDALCHIRKELEKDDLLLVCNGTSRHIYPSPMSRSMGCGEKAYKLSMGKQASKEDLVSIFETGPDVQPVTLSEQETYYDEWLKSLH